MRVLGSVSADLEAAGGLSSLNTLPAGVLIVFGVLGVLELALAVVALVVLVRTPKTRVTLPKWGWALLIIFINVIGSILFLTIGRRPAPAVVPQAPEGSMAARPSASSVAGALYGDATKPAARHRNVDDGRSHQGGTR